MGRSHSDISDDVIETVRVREVAGVFHTRDAVEAAVGELTLAGFDRADIDMMASVDAVKQKLGTVYVPAEEIADVPNAPRRAFVAREDQVIPAALGAGILTYIGAIAGALSVVASGGAVALAAAAAVAGGALTGGLGALVLTRHLEEKQAAELEAALVAGGLVLWVRVRSSEQEQRAMEILRRRGGEAVRVHEISMPKSVADIPLSRLRPDPWLGEERLGDP